MKSKRLLLTKFVQRITFQMGMFAGISIAFLAIKMISNDGFSSMIFGMAIGYPLMMIWGYIIGKMVEYLKNHRENFFKYPKLSIFSITLAIVTLPFLLTIVTIIFKIAPLALSNTPIPRTLNDLYTAQLLLVAYSFGLFAFLFFQVSTAYQIADWYVKSITLINHD